MEIEMTNPNPTRVMLTKVRLAFPVLNEPEQFQGQGNFRYSATLIMDPGSLNHKDCIAAMRAAAVAKWGEAKADTAVKGLTAGLKVALYNGDLKESYDGFAGNMIVGAHSQANNPPRLLDADGRTELPRNTGRIYAGCYVNASVEFWGQDNQYGKRLNAQIRGVQFHSDGDSFGAGSAASADEFGTVEGAPTEAATDEDFA
jgi:hypothetical protein